MSQQKNVEITDVVKSRPRKKVTTKGPQVRIIAMPKQKVLVTGATSQIGPYLIDLLVKHEYVVQAVSRRPQQNVDGHQFLKWHHLTDDISKIINEVKPDVWLNSGPLALISEYLLRKPVHNIQRIVGVSSTGVVTKINSQNVLERKSVKALREAEICIAQECHQKNIPWTIFRPTLIYSNGRDKNISVIISLIKKLKIFPVWDNGQGRRQPVHAEDIAEAMFHAIDCEKSYGKIYALSGAQVLSYRQMLEVLFKSLGLKPRIINLPYSVLVLAINALRLLPKYRYLNSEMVSRMNDDLSFDHSQAKQDLGFSPRDFSV